MGYHHAWTSWSHTTTANCSSYDKSCCIRRTAIWSPPKSASTNFENSLTISILKLLDANVHSYIQFFNYFLNLYLCKTRATTDVPHMLVRLNIVNTETCILFFSSFPSSPQILIRQTSLVLFQRSCRVNYRGESRSIYLKFKTRNITDTKLSKNKKNLALGWVQESDSPQGWGGSVIPPSPPVPSIREHKGSDRIGLLWGSKPQKLSIRYGYSSIRKISSGWLIQLWL